MIRPDDMNRQELSEFFHQYSTTVKNQPDLIVWIIMQQSDQVQQKYRSTCEGAVMGNEQKFLSFHFFLASMIVFR